MTKELYDLLTSDIYTDDSEYADRVKRIRQLTANTTFAAELLEREARILYGSDDLEIDPEPPTSEADGGTWVQAWVWVQDSDLCPHGDCRGDCSECEIEKKLWPEVQP